MVITICVLFAVWLICCALFGLALVDFWKDVFSNNANKLIGGFSLIIGFVCFVGFCTSLLYHVLS